MTKWYVLHVQNGRERDVAQNLKSRGFSSVVPTENRVIRKGGKWTQKEYIVFKENIEDFYTYDDMGDAMEKWLEMYYGEPRWLKKSHGKTLNLPSSVSAEFARLMMVGFDVKITGSPFADYLI